MSLRDRILFLFVLFGALLELGLFFIFIDQSMRGRATAFWMFSLWPCIIFPFVGLFLLARRMITPTWCLFLIAVIYCLWYQLSMYGWSLFSGSMLFIGLGHLLTVALLLWTWRLRPQLKELVEQ